MILVLARTLREVMDWARRHRLHDSEVMWIPPDEPHLAEQRIQGRRPPNLVRLGGVTGHPELEAALRRIGAVEVPETARVVRWVDNVQVICPDAWDTVDRTSDHWRRRRVTDVHLPGDGKGPGMGVTS